MYICSCDDDLLVFKLEFIIYLSKQKTPTSFLIIQAASQDLYIEKKNEKKIQKMQKFAMNAVSSTYK